MFNKFLEINMPENLIESAEKGILLAIGVFTLYAMGQETYTMIMVRHHVDLRDLLLMFNSIILTSNQVN
jgi:hypothetical protein